METIFIKHPIEANEYKQRTVMALGFFDGVHKGHQLVIEQAKSEANASGVPLSVMTFYPHPLEVLRPDNERMHVITSLPDKMKYLEQLGVDYLYVIEFSIPFSRLTPQQFVDDYLRSLEVIHVVAGFDFTYGAMGKGNMKTLIDHAQGQFNLTTVDKLSENNEKVSSTRIRKLIVDGEIEHAAHLLSRAYVIKGTVSDGEKRGRQIGFPTANIAIREPYTIPKVGVYAVEFIVDQKKHEGVCNIGYKPTFHAEREKPSIEVHIFNFDQSIYGKEVEVRWLKRIRDEQKFSNVNELVSQITKDKQTAKAFFANR
ncbi:riboflavin biosynthesis protein RibF [Halalkalibacter sp. APA_J-10(15)]|uniref:riboflavin biosynthesis protein RibF n=1 Tax=unclassified Halalkalibacter TaxID=2893063 RepID=UPI001FF125AD|nr:riboflavin biosynthesis protein RibF [Halalkalibacter sp. APA_J-10(15)]MCK0470798.1 riboflavin biosynthesis protein RibF [Halalkalibacter sp. APA_J-10(15)]